MSTIRTFVAVELQPSVLDELARFLNKLKRLADGYRWVDQQQLHMTLSFLGDVPESEIPQVCQAVGESAAKHESFQMTLRGFGAFPSQRRPRVAWVGVAAGHDELVKLQSGIARSVKPFSKGRDRFKFNPHVTLGRLKRDQRPQGQLSELIDKYADLQIGESLVSEVVVFSSYLERTGPTYTAMARCPLKT